MTRETRRAALSIAVVGIALSAGRAAAAPPPVGAPPRAMSSGVCGVLSSTPSGTIDAFDRYAGVLATATGGILIEVRSSADVVKLSRSFGVEPEAIRCGAETQAVWYSGVKDPESLSTLLVAKAARVGARLEVVRWVGFGATSSIDHLRATCQSAAACSELARRVPRDERCAILLLYLERTDTPRDAQARCMALPEEVTRCAAPALVSPVPALRDSCVAFVYARLR